MCSMDIIVSTFATEPKPPGRETSIVVRCRTLAKTGNPTSNIYIFSSTYISNISVNISRQWAAPLPLLRKTIYHLSA